MLDDNQEKVEDNKSNLEQDVHSSPEKITEAEQQVASISENEEVSGAVNEIEEEIATVAEETIENTQVSEAVNEL